jgi:RNA polymerase sigma factor (sigma-70 family)
MSKSTRTDPSAEDFDSLYRERHGRLLDHLTGVVRDRDRAEDIAATAFQAAWQNRAQFRGESSLASWLYAIGLNAARKPGQLRIVYQDPTDLERSGHVEPDRLGARLEEDERREVLWAMLHQIPAKCRRLLVDHYLNGSSVQEIARRDRVPEGTVMSRLYTARQLLREAWSRSLEPAEHRAMRNENIRSTIEDALQRLANELKAGRSEALENYLAMMGRFRQYSWTNQLLIMSQRPTATRVAGYHTWRDLGRFVKKGEKGIMIVAPVLAKQPDRETPPLGETRSKEDARPIAFRATYVFDVEQTDGRPLAAFVQTTGDPKEHGDRLKAVIADRGITIAYDPSIAPAQGVSLGGRICLMPGLAPAEEFSVLAHEFAHEILHHNAEVTRVDKKVRETQAEAVAFAVCRGIGLETRSAAADYIALYKGDSQTLAASLAVIQDAATKILEELLPEGRLLSPESIGRATVKSEKAPAPQSPSEPSRNEPRLPADPLDSISLDR